ncbi:aminoacyl-tRNA hydrolase [Mycoplasma phocoenae]|uniref:Peptidyl-tRNA hydrolase n=1 Tax=Mycoplasma phocoenae TaxID=754517 RepID=A0A858U949_9MOLU|nr:aminoacyl-tRNA hydrolase [Mycoplasma phocoenae]QJG67226.1 aminoacyl-tRNA hydrolase [Mycoplasma phocoenae]
MKLIIGLGNPGSEYVNTRHNVGFSVVDQLVDDLGLSSQYKEKFKGLFIKNDDFIIAKPLTYMNLSGDFVQSITQFYKINVADIIVVYDDMDHNVGSAVVKSTGSAGGHNGMGDIIQKMGTKEIRRLKIGIGRPKQDAKKFVLGTFNSIEKPVIEQTIKRSVEFLKSFLFNDIRFAITQFNTENK